MNALYGDSIFSINENKTNNIVSKNGKNYEIHTTPEIDKIAKQAADILKEYIKKLYSLPEWKEVKKNVDEDLQNGKTKLVGLHKMPGITYDTWEYNHHLIYCIQTDPYWMSQDNFYAEYAPGKHVYDLMDDIFKKLSSDTRLKKIPKFNGAINGDDYAMWGIELKLDDNDIVYKEEIKKK